jgi:uncharacterized protein (DUF427 family)
VSQGVRRIEPGPGQESAWDYPRPPRVEATPRRVRVVFAGETVADSRRALRLLETSHPPTYYVPSEDVRREWLVAVDGSSFCEFKGLAAYWSLRVGERLAERCAWSYPEPSRAYQELRDHLAFYPSRVDACYVDDERVEPQAGDFYGGWVTRAVVGPFKGAPGTWGW